VVSDCGGVLNGNMIDDPLALLSMSVWLFAAGMWPVAFLFGACSPCCQPGDPSDPCPWLLEFDRCLRVSVVGSAPPDGGDFRVSLTRLGFGDVERMGPGVGPIEIHHVQSEIRITVRISISASGASRTPVGDTRTQVWRFNRATPTSPAATAYDVLGPAWHLEVELSVTGVATQAEAGVTTSIGVDSEGQPKLFVMVNQWTATIARDEVVTLFPVGLQRWFGLTTSSVTATLVSGTSYSGWTVSKLTGLTILQRKYAVRVLANALPFAFGTLVQRVLLNDEVAVDFITGNGTLRVPASLGGATTDIDLSILPDNVICGLSRDFLHLGIPLGIYPEFMTLEVPASFTENFPRPIADWCGPDTLAMRPRGGPCLSGWAPSYFRQGVSVSTPVATVASFYPGRTLLWNLEQGPYRTSFTAAGPSSTSGTNEDWLVTLGGDGDFSLYDTPSFGCPQGTTSVDAPRLFPSIPNPVDFGYLCTPLLPEGSSGLLRAAFFATVNYDAQVEVVDQVLPLVEDPFFETCVPEVSAKTENFSGSVTITMRRSRVYVEDGTLKVDFVGDTTQDGSEGFLQGTKEVVAAYVIPITNDRCIDPNRDVIFFGLFLDVAVTLTCTVPCDDSGELEASVTNFFAVVGPPGDATFPLEGETPLFHLDGIKPLGIVRQMAHSISLTYAGPSTIPFATNRRRICTNWSLGTIPVEGATVTRTCDDQFGGGAPGTPVLSQSFGEAGSRLPRLIATNDPYEGTESILREGNCKLLGIANQGASTSTGNPLGSPLFLSATQGTCYYYVPTFGNDGAAGTVDADPCGASAVPTSLPCGDCVVTVTQTAGEENGIVRLITSGDKAGLIEIIAARTWLGGQGVTFTVSCGGDTITQVVRRANTVPEAPTNLTAVRDPCSTATLTWEAPHDGGQPITSYRVEYRVFNTGSYLLFGTVAANSLSAAVTGLLRLGYQFRVAATNSLGTGGFSNIAVVDGFTLGAPTNLTFTRDPCDEVQLSWTPPATTECVFPASYRLEYRVGITGTFLVFGTVAGTQTTGTITGLDPTLRYQFRVARVADAGGDLFSNTVTSGTVPATPTGAVAALGTEPGEVDVTWNANELLCFGNTDYLVQFRPSTTSTWSDFARAASANKFATVTGLTAATYFFRVRATNSIGNSGFSAASNSVTIPEPE
jgi:hypothetical protein